MGNLYISTTGAEPTTAAQSSIALTAATLQTVMQVATPSTKSIKVRAYGVSFDNNVANQPGSVELIQTDVSVTATGSTSRTPTLYDGPLDEASLCVGGTTATCFHTSTAQEGTITAVRTLDLQFIPPTGNYEKWFPSDCLPKIPVSKFLRLRLKFPTVVNVYGWILWEE